MDLDRAADNGGVLVNDAVASGTDISGDLVGGEASHEFEIPEVGMITLEKSGEITSGEGNQVGDEITYTFTVNNTGTSDLLVVTIDDAVLDVNDLAVTPATILPGQSGTATYTHVLTQADIDDAAANGGVITNEATVSAEDESGAPVSSTSNVVEIALPEQTCSDDPVQDTCSVVAGFFQSVQDIVPDELVAEHLSSGVFGSGEYGGSGANSLGAYAQQHIPIPIPPHSADCFLVLQVQNGLISTMQAPATVADITDNPGFTPVVYSQCVMEASERRQTWISLTQCGRATARV